MGIQFMLEPRLILHFMLNTRAGYALAGLDLRPDN